MNKDDNITPFPDKTGSKQETRFKKGQSGNISGRPKGALNRTTRAAMTLLDGQAQALTEQAISMALTGDSAALKLCFDRILPTVRERTLPPLDLPAIRSKADLASLHETLLHHLSEGTITLSEATALYDFAVSGQQHSEQTDPCVIFARIIAGAIASPPAPPPAPEG